MQNIPEFSYELITNFLNNDKGTLFFENPFLGITIADSQGVVLRVNQSHSRITGMSDWVGKNFHDMVRDGSVSESATLNVLETRQEVTIRQRLSNNKNFLVHAFPVFENDDTQLRYIVSFLLDVSEIQCLKKEIDRVGSRISRLLLIEENRIIYQSKQMQEIIDCAHTVANSDATVLITGESGVGKEAIAALIHENSARKNNPFIKINCNAIPESLMESELFGYEPGTFTGGNKQGKRGILEKANSGTIFLDEIGDMPLNLQVKLLRVLQEHEIRRLGGHQDIKIDIRVVAATNASLLDMIRSKKFRLDLYYRLNVIPINIPNLQDRKEDIPILANYFLSMFNEKYDREKKLAPCALQRLMSTRFEGNVRHLRNIIERLVLLSPKESISLADVEKIVPEEAAFLEPKEEGLVQNQHGEDQEAEKLRDLYEKHKSSYKIAKLLNMNQSTIWRKLKKYQVITH